MSKVSGSDGFKPCHVECEGTEGFRQMCINLKFISLLLVPSWLRGRDLDWRLSQPGFDPSNEKLVCLATLMSSDRTKQICLWMTIYIYIKR